MLSKAPANHDFARDMLAALITQNHGEYVFRIGAQPSKAKLFAGDLNDDVEAEWTGTRRTEDQLDFLVQEITSTVEEVGGKVKLTDFISTITDHIQKTSLLSEVSGKHPRKSLLLRLPPPNVSLTPEVRCAVVGNVDSGKSTTLGVLTRGVFNGRGIYQ